MIGVSSAASDLCSKTKKGARRRCLDPLPTFGVFQEASHRELYRSGSWSVIDGSFNGEVSRSRRLRTAVVISAHRADDGHHGTPLFGQVAAVVVEVGYVSRVPGQVSRSERCARMDGYASSSSVPEC